MTDFPDANDIVFTDAVRRAQERYGSRGKGASLEAKGRFARPITADVAAYIALRDSAYFGTASADGRSTKHDPANAETAAKRTVDRSI